MWMDALKEGANFRIDKFYEMGELIGSGGFADVHAAYDRETGAKTAVKTIKKGSDTDEFLQREITILRHLNHPNVVRTLDIFESSESYQVVMEFVDGGNLQDKISATKEFSEDEVRHVMGQILQGLAFIHSRGIVHRDLKHENILLTSDCKVKIADFGLSKFYDACSDGLMKTLVGTPEFVAPELIRNEKYGIEVDAWACGIIMFSLTTGTPPFSPHVVLQNYRKNLVLINWQRPGWRRFSEQAKNLARMLLCVDPSCRVNPVGAMHHRWFTDPENQTGTGHHHCVGNRPAQESRPAHSVTVHPPTKANLLKLRRWVHAIRFLRRNLRKTGKSTSFGGKFRPFKLKDVELVPNMESEESAVSVGCDENTGTTTWDYVVQDLSRGTMDSVSYSPAPSPRNRNRKPTLAASEMAGSMASMRMLAQTSDSGTSSTAVKHAINDKGEVAASSFIQYTGGAQPTRVVLSSVSPLCRNVRPENIRPLRINPHSSIGTRLRMERDRANASARGVVLNDAYRSRATHTANAGAGTNARGVRPGGSSAAEGTGRQSHVTGSRVETDDAAAE